MGLRNAADLIYDIFSKDINLIQPPYLANLTSSKFALFGEMEVLALTLITSKVNDPTIYVHKSQLARYC